MVSHITALPADGPGVHQVPKLPDGPRVRRRNRRTVVVLGIALGLMVAAGIGISALTLPMGLISLVVLGPVVVIATRWLPRSADRTGAVLEGRVGIYEARLPKSDIGWTVSGLGTDVSQVSVRVTGLASEAEDTGNAPDALVVCLDARTGAAVAASGGHRGREPQTSLFRFEPPALSEPTLLLGVDHPDRLSTGHWTVRISLTTAHPAAPESLTFQRLSAAEFTDLLPADGPELTGRTRA
jgi:hypothetical protein